MRIVVLFPGALGDLCLLAPALRALAAHGARVELGVRRALVPIARVLLPALTLGPPLDGRAMASLFGAGALDPAITGWLAAADRVHAWLARARDDALAARLDALRVPAVFHAVPRDDGTKHVSLEYATALGVDDIAVTTVEAPVAHAALPWRGPAARRLLVHPGAGARAKVWPIDGFAKVADDWRHDGGEVVVLLGPAEETEALTWTPLGYEPIVGWSLVDAAALVANAPHWIGNDSGMSHLAGALGRHGVVLFCATRPARWRPLGGRLTAVECAGRSTEDVACDALALLRTSISSDVP